MPNFASLLKTEIARLARREAKSLVSPLKTQVQQLRSLAKQQKLRMAALERKQSHVTRQAVAVTSGKASKPEAAGDGTRLGPRSIRAQRKRLGLSQTDMGRLLDVSHVTVFNWESGRAKPRGANRDGLISLRDFGRRDVKAKLKDAPPARRVQRGKASPAKAVAKAKGRSAKGVKNSGRGRRRKAG